MDPYRPPQSGMALSQKGAVDTADPFDGLSWEIGSTARLAVARVKQGLLPFIACVALYGGFTLVNAFAAQVPRLVAGSEGDPVLATLLVQFTGGLLSVLVQLGVLKVCFKIARGLEVSVGDALPTLGMCVSVFLAMVVVGSVSVAALFLGLVTFLVPAIFWGLFTFFWRYGIVDQEMGFADSINQSFALVKNQKMKLFLWSLVVFAAFMVVALLTCGLGGLVAYPFLLVCHVLIYDNLKLTKEQRGIA